MVDSPFFCLIKSEVYDDFLVVVIYRMTVFSDNRNIELSRLVCAERAFALRDCQSLGVFVPREGDTPVFLPGKSHGWRSLVGYSPWDCKELDTTERICTQSPG